MDLHNRFGDKIEPESGGLIGPDGKPLVPESAPEEKIQEQEPELDFFNYIGSLSFQAMIFLGEIPHPLTNQIDKNLKQAKFLIDTLVVIKDKTVGNLTKEEADLINGSIYELQLRYVEAVKKEQSSN